MRGKYFSLIALLACSASMVACGSDDDTTVVKTITEPSQTQATTTTAGGLDATTEPGPVGNYPAPPSRHLTLFQSPSGNIGCYMSTQASGYARCDIGDRSWSPPAQPASCDLDWGQGVEVSGAGPGQIVCAGDTTLDPAAPVLDYGESSRAGLMLCLSRESGVACTNTDTGHGFFLASESYRLF